MTGFPALTYAIAWNNIPAVQAMLEYEPNLRAYNPTSS
jgi:hypothetical protein